MMQVAKKDELLNSEDARIQVIKENLETWVSLEDRMHAEYMSFLRELHKERREMIKYLGTIAGGAAALAPQLLSNVQQLRFFYAGISLLCLVVIVSVTYVISTIENDTAIFSGDLRNKKEVLYRMKKPKLQFLKSGDYSIDAFIKAMSGVVEELPKLEQQVEVNRIVDNNGWYKSMDYTGEFIIWFFISGISLLVLSLSGLAISGSYIFWTSIAIFVVINLISTFPIYTFRILGSPIDLIKSGIRYIFKKSS